MAWLKRHRVSLVAVLIAVLLFWRGLVLVGDPEGAVFYGIVAVMCLVIASADVSFRDLPHEMHDLD